MNISFENALLEDCDEVRFKYDNLYIKGRHIRYIHLPKEVRLRYSIVFSLLQYTLSGFQKISMSLNPRNSSPKLIARFFEGSSFCRRHIIKA